MAEIVHNIGINVVGNAFDKLADVAFKVNNLTQGISQLGQSFASITNAGATAQMQLMNMTTLYKGNTEQAKAMYDQIAQYGKETVYDKRGLIQAQSTMMQFGIEGEKAFGTLKQIGDIAMGDSQRMQSLALAFSQATSAGKLQGQDLMQMINAGFNPLNVIAEKTGKSMADLKKEMSEGKISADMLAQAFQWATEEGGLFYQGAEKGGETWQGKIAQIQDSIEEFKISIFEATGGATAYLQVATQITAELTPLYQGLLAVKSILSGGGSVATKAFNAIKTGARFARFETYKLGLAIKTSGGFFPFLATQAKIACKGIGTAIKGIPVVGWIIAIITAVTALFTYLYTNCEAFRDFFKNSFMGQIIKIFLPVLSLIMTIIDEFDSLKRAFTEGGFLAGIKRVGYVLFKALADPLIKVLETIGQFVPLAATAASKLRGWLNEADAATDVKKKVYYSQYDKSRTFETEQESKEYSAYLQKGGKPEDYDKYLAEKNGTAMPNLGTNANQGEEASATGGTRNTNINIKIGNMIERCIFQGGTSENKDTIADNFAQALNRALGLASTAV